MAIHTADEMHSKIEQLKTADDISTADVFDIFSFFIQNSKRFYGISKGDILQSPDIPNTAASARKNGDIEIYNHTIDEIAANFRQDAKESGVDAVQSLLASIVPTCEHECDHLVQQEIVEGKRIHLDGSQFAKEQIAIAATRGSLYEANRYNMGFEQDANIVAFYRTPDVLEQYSPQAASFFQKEAPIQQPERYSCLSVPFGETKINLDFEYYGVKMPIHAPLNIAATQIADIFIPEIPELLQYNPVLKREYNPYGKRKPYAQLMQEKDAWINELMQTGQFRSIIPVRGKKYTAPDAVRMFYDNIIKSSPELQKQAEQARTNTGDVLSGGSDGHSVR